MRRAAAIAAGLALSACATTQLPPVGAPGYEVQDEERAMLRLSATEQARLDAGGDVHEDAALEEYVNDVARRLLPPAARRHLAVRVKILRNHRLNAFALPNGAVYVHTGMLSRMEDEAELAVLVGHELVHATHRHAVREQRSASNWSGAMAGISAATLGLAAPLGRLAAGAAVSGHSRDAEREADREGLRLAAAAGYDVSAAPALFEHLAEWVKEESDGEDDEPFFFGSHPRLEERRESMARLVAAEYGGRAGTRNADAFRRRIAPLLLVNARLALEAGRYDAARRDVERHLAIAGRSAAAHALLGEAARRRGGDVELAASVGHYRTALGLDGRLAEAHRGLGLALHKLGRRDEARAALLRYLQLAPHATDRAHVRALLERDPP